MAVRYTAEHAGQVKTRTSRQHTAPHYTHAWFALIKGKWVSGFSSSRGLASNQASASKAYNADEVAVVEVKAEVLAGRR